jgi:hypothetical protein
MKISTLCGAFALCLGAGFAQEDYTTWGRVKTLTLNTSATGANLTENTGNFPLLIRLDSTHAEVFQQSKTGGADLRFRRVSGPQLAYFIASWDSAARKAEIWVSVDTVFANNASQQIRMYWQKASATAASSAAAVFSTAKGFTGAWNMGGAAGPRANYVNGGATARPGLMDSAGAYTGISTRGVVGTADSLRGGSATAGARDYFDVGPVNLGPNGFAVSAWVYVAANAGNWYRVYDFGSGEAADNVFLARSAASSDWMFDIFASQDAFAPAAIALGQWQHIVTTMGALSEAESAYPMNIFINGASAGTGTAAVYNDVERVSAYLGRSNWATDAYFTGLMDEVQISNVPRSAGWAKLAYATQRPGANLLVWSASGPGSSVAPAARMKEGALRIRREGAGYAFELPSAGSEARLTVTDMSGRRVWSRAVGRAESRVTWEAVSASGAPAARGAYVARLEIAGEAAVYEGVIAHVR